MKQLIKTLIVATAGLIAIAGCKKTSSKPAVKSPIVGFWTYKEDPANDYWNDNVLFNSDGTFRMYTSLSLADTSAAQAILYTADQVVTFGTYTVKGDDVEMVWQEFSVIDFTFSGTMNSGATNIIGNLDSKEPGTASPLWYLTKP